ncbi:MAG TPA: YheC/YheD family protein [Symbiobacteriaceae bacterium]|nr:YheC/YheD family protein [Symbiobacteriaceae bacterium]
MEVAVRCDRRLPDGTVILPDDIAAASLRLGCNSAALQQVRPGRAGSIVLASDLWRQLSVPFDGMSLNLHAGDGDEVILGPSVAVLYAGKASSISTTTARERLALFFGDRTAEAGLYALAFDESIDWETGLMDGFVLNGTSAVPAQFPIPAAVHLRWAILRDVIEALRERTGGKVFNWVRNMSKWQFYSLLSPVPELTEYLPETRVLRSFVDLAAMLVRHESVFVKQVFGIRGIGSARVRRIPEGFELAYLQNGAMAAATLPRVNELMEAIRATLGTGKLIVQQGLDLTGARGRRLDFRVVAVRDGAGGWRCALRHAKVAPDETLVFMNLANGATDSDMLEALEQHCGLAPAEAEQTADAMTALALRTAEVLAGPYHPLGILGIDLARDMATGRVYLLEANTVPGWSYPEPVETALARSMAAYALSLAAR